MSVNAYILITANSKATKNALKILRASNFIKSADIITGPFDIIATAQADNIDALGQLVTDEIQSIDGIERTISCIVLK